MSSDQPSQSTSDLPDAWTALQRHASRGLPSVQPGMPLTVVLAILVDYLRDNGLVQRCSYTRHGNQITCQFATCPLAPPDQARACQVLRQLAQATLARGGHPVEVAPATPTDKAIHSAFSLRLLTPDGKLTVCQSDCRRLT